MTFYQACYGKPGNNWQLLNVSKDIPPYMASFFEGIGNNCTPQNIKSDTLSDKQGNPVILYELISAENIICVVRAKYGERDNFGRPKMFAHGFLFPAEGAYKEPADYLFLADSNFHFTDAETSNIPSQLDFDAKLKLKDAFDICGIKSVPSWQKMIKCIYAILSSATDYPLYIRCDGKLSTIKATILCILSALPYSLRYRLSFSNADSLSYAKSKRVMFIETIPEGGYYFDLESGDTNLLSEIKEIDQYPDNYAAYHAFSNCKSMQNLKLYFESIQEVLDKLSFGYVTEMDEINLAHLFVSGVDSVDSMDNSKLMKLILELLVKSPMQNTYADDYIARILEKIDNRELILADNILKRIELRGDKTSSVDFVNAYEKMKMRSLLSKGQKEAVAFLGEQYRKSKSIFNKWAQLIWDIPNGKESVALFFKNKIGECRSYEDIVKVNEDVLEYYDNSYELTEAVISQIKSIAQNRIFNLSISDADFELEFELLKRCMDSITNSDGKKIFDVMLGGIIVEFWRRFDYSDFEFNEKCVYNCVAMSPNDLTLSKLADSKALEKYSDVSLLADIFDSVTKYKEGNRGYWDVERAVSIFKDQNSISAYVYDEDVIIKKLQEFLRKSMYLSEGKRNFCMWLNFIQLGRNRDNPILTFIRWELPVVCNAECFATELRESQRMSRDSKTIKEWLSKVVEDAEYYCISDENVKILKSDIKVIDNFNKEIVAEEKRKSKDQFKKENVGETVADRKRWVQGTHKEKKECVVPIDRNRLLNDSISSKNLDHEGNYVTEDTEEIGAAFGELESKRSRKPFFGRFKQKKKDE